MRLGNLKIFIFCIILYSQSTISLYGDDSIKSVPLINLEDLSPTFEEDKDELEKAEEKNNTTSDNENLYDASASIKNDKIYVNLKALDKITAKTSDFRLAVGEKKFFGALEIKALKCQMSEGADISDTVAYLQVKDLSAKDNNQVFLFNGWTFASSPTLQSLDHPVYDLWITSCENI
tara:strand:+ start:228 stop:758 length:531 start_codon:yes stop_codon:yes gene_type:complete